MRIVYVGKDHYLKLIITRMIAEMYYKEGNAEMDLGEWSVVTELPEGSTEFICITSPYVKLDLTNKACSQCTIDQFEEELDYVPWDIELHVRSKQFYTPGISEKIEDRMLTLCLFAGVLAEEFDEYGYFNLFYTANRDNVESLAEVTMYLGKIVITMFARAITTNELLEMSEINRFIAEMVTAEDADEVIAVQKNTNYIT